MQATTNIPGKPKQMDGSTTTTEQKIKSDGTRIVEDNKGQEAVQNHDRLRPHRTWYLKRESSMFSEI